MPEFSTTRRVRHNASDMFDLVADVERYPEFLPLCSGMKLRNRKDGKASELAVSGVFPFVVGIFISELTIYALFLGKPVPIRLVLMVAAFTISQAAYTNFMAWTSQTTRLDRAFIPNLCYAVSVGLWLTFRFRGIKPGALSLP